MNIILRMACFVHSVLVIKGKGREKFYWQGINKEFLWLFFLMLKIEWAFTSPYL